MEILYNFNRDWTDSDKLIHILCDYKKKIITNKLSDDMWCTDSIESLKTLFLMIPYCRDIFFGKGERDLSYRIIYAWYQVFPVLAIKAIHFFLLPRKGLPCITSWCDIKYFCLFIQKISPLGLYDPLIEIVVNIANRQLWNDMFSDGFVTNISKWIPREKNHPELFSVFVSNWFPLKPITSVKKKLYRQMISSLCSRIHCLNGYRGMFLQGSETSNNLGLSFPSMFIGEYVRKAIQIIKEGSHIDKINWLNKQWKRMTNIFSNGSNGLAVVDTDISISDDKLFHSLGFACFIAEKMKLKRILLAGSVTTFLDISQCNGFVSIISLLWSYCEIRGKSNLASSLNSVKSGLKYIFDESFNLFIFSEKFDFNWRTFLDSIKEKGKVIFWNMGSLFTIPVDFYICPDKENPIDDFIYMSGYAPGLMSPFCKSSPFIFTDVLNEQYPDWIEYYDLFINEVYKMPISKCD